MLADASPVLALAAINRGEVSLLDLIHLNNLLDAKEAAEHASIPKGKK